MTQPCSQFINKKFGEEAQVGLGASRSCMDADKKAEPEELMLFELSWRRSESLLSSATSPFYERTSWVLSFGRNDAVLWVNSH